MKVTYFITPKENEDIYLILKDIERDISYGTFVDPLTAASKTINSDSYKNFRPQTTLKNLENPPYEVEFEFDDRQFNFEEEGLNHFIGTIAGDILRNRKIKEIIVDDFSLKDYSYFPGPKLGNDNLKKNFFSKNIKTPRPLLAFSIKPRIGYDSEQYEKILSHACLANVDIIEDDERILSPTICTFSQRLNAVKKILKTDTKSKISINLTGNPHNIERLTNEAYEAGIRVFKLDVTVVGFDTLLFLRKLLNSKEEDCIITVFPDVYGIVYRCLSRKFILKLARLCGADIMYAGSPFPSRMGEIIKSHKKDNWFEDIRKWMHACKKMHSVLISDISGAPHIKSCLPTITHDVNPQIMESLIYLMKLEINDKMEYAFFVGGGISSFKCNFDIKKSAELWMKVLRYAGGFNLKDLSLEDFYELERYDSRGYKKCIQENGWDIHLSSKKIKYRRYD